MSPVWPTTVPVAILPYDPGAWGSLVGEVPAEAGDRVQRPGSWGPPGFPGSLSAPAECAISVFSPGK